MSQMPAIILRILSLAVLGAPSTASAGPPPLWGKLAAGPHAVGFKSLWQLDYSRRYNMTFDDKATYSVGKAPRPILINIWYPATKVGDAKPMPHRGYLDIQSADPRLAKFAQKLTEYDHTVIAKEIFDKPIKELSDRESGLLKEFLETPTACFRNAAPADGSFPLVIYHSGNGSSFEDNSVLCEFLASHGYIVFGSAFQRPDGSSFNVDNADTGDFEFLIGYAKQLPHVDWKHIGVIGHSAGAHAALTYRSRSNCAADAIVSLDTTEDYYSIADPRWEPMTTAVTKNRKYMTGPLLLVANPHAFFQLADSLSSARRYYFTIKDLDHNDFISQGGIGRALRYRLQFDQPGAPAAEAAEINAKVAAVKTAYASLCDYVLHFLDAELKGDAAAREFVEKRYRDTKLSGIEPHVVAVPEGRAGPDPYEETSAEAPTPRQLRYFLHDHGVDQTIALLRRLHKQSPAEPIFHQVFGFALVGDLLDQGKVQDAIAFHKYYRELGVDSAKIFAAWADLYVRLGGRNEWARNYYKRVLLLDPSNREVADKLKRLDEKIAKP